MGSISLLVLTEQTIIAFYTMKIAAHIGDIWINSSYRGGWVVVVGGGNPPLPLEDHIFSATEHLVDPRPGSKL